MKSDCRSISVVLALLALSPAGCYGPRLNPLPPKTSDPTPAHAALTTDDYLRHVQLCREAAAVGQVEAQYALATLYREGRGLPQDLDEAIRWYRLAAEAGHALAQYNLGVMLGRQDKMAEAIPWMERAAAQGVPQAPLFLGGAYVNGAGVGRDLVRAYAYLRLAADSGSQPASQTLFEVKARLTDEELAEAERLADELSGKPRD